MITTSPNCYAMRAIAGFPWLHYRSVIRAVKARAEML